MPFEYIGTHFALRIFNFRLSNELFNFNQLNWRLFLKFRIAYFINNYIFAFDCIPNNIERIYFYLLLITAEAEWLIDKFVRWRRN